MAVENKENIIYSFLTNPHTDPTMLSFDFEINPRSILFCSDEYIEQGSIDFWDDACMLKDFTGKVETAISTPHILLKNLGETNRDALLLRFSSSAKKVFAKTGEQWRVQSIDGLDAVFTNIMNYSESYMGSGTDNITITCIDDVELTMFNMFEMYRRAVYDPIYKRQIIPNNLLQFDCKVVISDRRNIVENNPTLRHSDISNNAGVTKSLLDSVRTPKEDSLIQYNNAGLKTFNKPVVELIFCNCVINLNSISKSFESINPGEIDNTWSHYSFSFRYGKTYIKSSYVELAKDTPNIADAEDKFGSINSVSSEAAKLNFQNSKVTTLSGLIDNGFDGAVESAKQFGNDYLDEVSKSSKNRIDEISKKITGQESGNEVGQNIYGKSNFISVAMNDIGETLKQYGNELVNAVNENVFGKTQSSINTLKGKVTGAMMNAESSIINNTTNSKKSTSVLNETNIYNGEELEMKSSGNNNNDVNINIYKSTPSGPNNN